jgi:hypothetical protein
VDDEGTHGIGEVAQRRARAAELARGLTLSNSETED